MTDETGIGICLGLDVDKSEQHASRHQPHRKRLFDKPLPNSEPKLRELSENLRARRGMVLVVVDRQVSIGTLPLGVARHTGCQVVYLRGPKMRRIADLYPGDVKTDACGAFIIAAAAPMTCSR